MANNAYYTELKTGDQMRIEGNYYRAPFGTGTIISTIIAVILIIPITAYNFFFVNPMIAVIITICLIFASLSVPLGYRVELTKIVIRRPIWNIHIPVGTMIDIESMDEGNVRMTPFSAIGNRGLFGWRFLVHLNNRGWASVHSKRTSDMVLITTYNKSYLLAPESPERFIEDVKFVMKAYGRGIGDDGCYQDGAAEIGSPEGGSQFAEVIED